MIKAADRMVDALNILWERSISHDVNGDVLTVWVKHERNLPEQVLNTANRIVQTKVVKDRFAPEKSLIKYECYYES